MRRWRTRGEGDVSGQHSVEGAGEGLAQVQGGRQHGLGRPRWRCGEHGVQKRTLVRMAGRLAQQLAPLQLIQRLHSHTGIL